MGAVHSLIDKTQTGIRHRYRIPVSDCRKTHRGIGGPQPSNCQTETSGVYGGFGTLA